MKRLVPIFFISLILTLSTSISFADNLDDGIMAALAGDYSKAYEFFLVEAKSGNSQAQYYLGMMYDNGKGVPQGYKEAVKWYRLAAEQGNMEAQYSLGNMYHNGKGVPQVYKEALKWYRLAAEQGHADAQLKIGGMYYLGQGVLQSSEDAYAWCVVAAANGSEDARKSMEVFKSGQMTPSQIERGQQIAKEIWVSIDMQ